MVSGAPVVAAQLKRIGITAEIENVEYAVWIKRWLAKDFDMTMNTTPGYADPGHRVLPGACTRPRGQNWNSWSVPELDALLEEGRRTMDQKKRKEIYDKVQIMILENVPHLWLFSAEHDRLHPGLREGLRSSTRRRCCTASRACGSTRPERAERARWAGTSWSAVLDGPDAGRADACSIFLMLRLVPGTVVEQMIGADADREPGDGGRSSSASSGSTSRGDVQYARWIGGLAHGRPRHLVADGQARGRADPRASARDRSS